MLVVFGNGKCPLCGDAAQRVEKKLMHCEKCDVAFDNYVLMGDNLEFKQDTKYWN